jgi:hypothetical protein
MFVLNLHLFIFNYQQHIDNFFNNLLTLGVNKLLKIKITV